MPKKKLLSFELFGDRLNTGAQSDDGGEHKRVLRAVRLAARGELTNRQMQCVVMRYGDNKSVKEIAAELGVCPSTVCRHLKKARARLKKVMEYYCEKRN